MVDPKEARASTAVDNASVHAKNTINVVMEDLNEDDRKAVEQELEREMGELRMRKLACFQKTRSGVVKKTDTATMPGAKVNSSLNPEDLVHMVAVLVASKYGDDLTILTRVMAEDLRSTFDVAVILTCSNPSTKPSPTGQISLPWEMECHMDQCPTLCFPGLWAICSIRWEPTG
jgi:hypothetical protein